jgi:hypothetical protein
MSPATKPVTGSEKLTVRGIGLVLVGSLARELMATVGRTESTVKVMVALFALTLAPELWAVA